MGAQFRVGRESRISRRARKAHMASRRGRTVGKTDSVSVSEPTTHDIVAEVERRTEEIVHALGAMSDETLVSPSRLPAWSMLTLGCHLRYGAHALLRMTLAALSGTPVAYYPEGRDQQRPATLQPLPGESPRDVVSSLATRCEELHRAWRMLDLPSWSRTVQEPVGNPDLGTVQLASLPLLRWTEVEVHGTDLGVGLADWSPLFVQVVLPMRLEWLNHRRTNHRAFDAKLEGSWLLVASDGPTYLITVRGTRVQSRPADQSTPARATIKGNGRDVLALLLGRADIQSFDVGGELAFGARFPSAFPGP
jgi:maleylpyruvate isomerase